jgi:hypothetical protein
MRPVILSLLIDSIDYCTSLLLEYWVIAFSNNRLRDKIEDKSAQPRDNSHHVITLK